ncbi:frataxin homolog, mitochondrial [Stomoxys calcitrans]|uniref:frataxin homolog, mitochondrial n=1 Tax=Stomoxys calcitrans TaxID=35570 RepID=UPI0027E33793|nr:frataxin homolog, mitochondrial [Stomoxys calcitrans]
MYGRLAANFLLRNIAKNQRNLRYLSVIKCCSLPRTIVATNYTAPQRKYSSTKQPTEHVVDSILDHATYERVCAETLDGLNDYFEQLMESIDNIPGSDLAYSDGVLTVNLGEHGTYVINRQTPNRQIWLSSPTSGPKRYDFVGESSGATGKWIYRHNSQSLHELLQLELQKVFETQKLEFEDLPFGGR